MTAALRHAGESQCFRPERDPALAERLHVGITPSAPERPRQGAGVRTSSSQETPRVERAMDQSAHSRTAELSILRVDRRIVPQHFLHHDRIAMERGPMQRRGAVLGQRVTGNPRPSIALTARRLLFRAASARCKAFSGARATSCGAARTASARASSPHQSASGNRSRGRARSSSKSRTCENVKQHYCFSP